MYSDELQTIFTTEGNRRAITIDKIVFQRLADEQLKSFGNVIDWSQHFIPYESIHTPFYGYENNRLQYLDFIVCHKKERYTTGLKPYVYTGVFPLEQYLEEQVTLRRKIKIKTFLNEN